MTRQEKIAIIGASGYDQQDDTHRVECFSWNRPSRLKSLSDYDTLILCLLEKPAIDKEFLKTFKALTPQVATDILKADGKIIIVGDPRFDVPDEQGATPFLWWTGLRYWWDSSSGDTVEWNEQVQNDALREYSKQIDRWSYALQKCDLDDAVLSALWGKDAVQSALSVLRTTYSTNRYGAALIFSAGIAMLEAERSGSIARSRRTLFEWSPILFLPSTRLSLEETLVRILRDLCGVEGRISEPEWIRTRKVPGQDALDRRIVDCETQISKLGSDLRDVQEERALARVPLKLFYERGTALEEVVREVFRTLGATVEDPVETGKEDGWITVSCGQKTYEGVLEVKSTKSDEFDEDGLRQLLDWKTRGVEARGKKYKGIFVGSSAVNRPPEERPRPFNKKWTESAALFEIAAITTLDLYDAFCQKANGSFDSEEFWKRLFETNGIVTP